MQIHQVETLRIVEIKKWLRRSGALPISISLFHPNKLLFAPDFKYLTPLAQGTLDVIARYAARLSTLEAVVTPGILRMLGVIIAPVGLGTQRTLPMLRRLKLLSDPRYQLVFDSREPDNGLSMLSAPHLQELFLFLPQKHLSTPRIHWSPSLTVLCLHEALDFGVIYSILVQCPGLQRCSLHINETSDEPVQVSSSTDGVNARPILPTIHLHALETLSIRGQISDIGFACRSLETPAIMHLQMYPFRARNAGWGNTPIVEAEGSDLIYPPESVQNVCEYLLRCTSLRSFTICPADTLGSEIQRLFHSLPNIDTLILDNNFTSRPSSHRVTQSTVFYGDQYTPLILGHLKYNLHPLLTQQRVSVHTANRIPIEQPLLANLTSFTWNQFSSKSDILDELLVSFIKSRLHAPASSVSYGVNSDSRTSSLKEVNIKLVTLPDTIDIGAEIAHHAWSKGLTAGVDFSLHISTYPWVECFLQPKSLYTIPKIRSEPSQISADNLIFNDDVTWPFFDI